MGCLPLYFAEHSAGRPSKTTPVSSLIAWGAQSADSFSWIDNWYELPSGETAKLTTYLGSGSVDDRIVVLALCTGWRFSETVPNEPESDNPQRRRC
jgi:hypothetical protein